MRPLLWKEMHDLRWWLLGALAMTGALFVLRRTQVFEGSFLGMWLYALMPLSAAGAAIGLGVGQVARERHSRTLDFLLSRPVSPGVIVWSKFLAGTAVLAVILTGAVALAFADPESTSDTGLLAIRHQLGMPQLLGALLPRFWCLYALSLFFSVLVDRSRKAAALAVVIAVTLPSLASVFAELAPFSGYVFWLPYFESTGGLLEAAKSWRMLAATGLVCTAGALLVTAVSASLLRRSAERYLGNRGLVGWSMAVIAVAFGSARAAGNRLPDVAPAGRFQLAEAKEWSAGIVASGATVVVSLDHRVRFLDFTEPAHPRQLAEVKLPLWNVSSDWSTDRIAIQNETVYLVGQKKSLPVDEAQIAVVQTGGVVDTIALGPVRAGDYASTPIVNGRWLYLGVTSDRVSSLRVFDLTSKVEVATQVIDRMLPPVPGLDEGQPPVRMVRRGTYLYVASPSYLTAIDIANPEQPRITSQLVVHSRIRPLYGFPRPMAWQDDRLFSIRIFPETLDSYDLSDPAHPTAKGELTFHWGVSIAGAERAMYMPWRAGILEFQAGREDLQARRYLCGDSAVSALAVTGSYLYALTTEDLHGRRSVQAFRVGK